MGPAWKSFGKSGSSIVFAPWDPVIFPSAGNPFLVRYNENWKNGPAHPARPIDRGPLPLTLGQVFLRGEPIRQSTSLEDLARSAGAWMVAPDGTGLLVHFPDHEQDHSIEVSVRSRLFAPHERGLHDIQVEGFCFEHCANQLPAPEAGAVSTRSGSRWVIRNNIIRHAGTIGLDFGGEGWPATAVEGEKPGATRVIKASGQLIEGNIVESNGVCGLCAWNIEDSVVRRNIVEHNNRLGFSPAAGVLVWEMAGIKILCADRVLVEENLVRDNECFGIWFDNKYNGCRATRNVVMDNALAGIFVELGMPSAPGETADEILVDHNIVAGTRGGDGIYAHDASGVTVAHNLIAGNAGFGIRMRNITDRKSRLRVLTETSDETIRNNILADNALGTISLPLPSARSHGIVCDGNLFLDSSWEPVRCRAAFAFENVESAGRLQDIKSEDVQRLVQSYQAAKAVSPNLGWIDPQIWRANPRLTLEQWQKLTGRDTSSIQSGKLSLVVRTALPEIEMRSGSDLTWPACQPVADVTRDFFGQPLPSSGLLPGPFQTPPANHDTVGLWPVPEPPNP